MVLALKKQKRFLKIRFIFQNLITDLIILKKDGLPLEVQKKIKF